MILASFPCTQDAKEEGLVAGFGVETIMVGLKGNPFAKAGSKGKREPSEAWRGGFVGKVVVMKT